MKRALKITFILLGAVGITSLGIDAADTISGVRGTLLSNVMQSGDQALCPQNMIALAEGLSARCIDMYEASPSDDCVHADPASAIDTQANIEHKNCMALSEKERAPWKNITREQAMQMCAKAGKRLPTNNEWYQGAIGTPDGANSRTCNIDSATVDKTGMRADCVSAVGAHDMIGNVWEWVTEDAVDGTYNGRPLPKEGYVSQVDANGVAVQSTDAPDTLFYQDYVWTGEHGYFGMMRGGFFASKNDAGVYAVHARTLPTTPGAAIGFRCVQ